MNCVGIDVSKGKSLSLIHIFVLVLRDLLADLGNLLVNALDFVLSHFNHSFSHKSALPVHQAVALDALVGQGITLDLAGVARIALHGVDPVSYTHLLVAHTGQAVFTAPATHFSVQVQVAGCSWVV